MKRIKLFGIICILLLIIISVFKNYTEESVSVLIPNNAFGIKKPLPEKSLRYNGNAENQELNNNKWQVLYPNNSRFTYDSISSLISDTNLTPGLTVFTKGYYHINDEGAGTYSIRTKTNNDKNDGGTIIFLKNGNVAELITNGTVSIKQFGAIGDGIHDDTKAINNALKSPYHIIFTRGDYLFIGTICIPNNKKLSGTQNVKLLYHATKAGESGLFCGDNIKLKNFNIDGTYNSVKERTINYANTITMHIKNKSNVVIENITINGGEAGIRFENSKHCIASNCFVDNVSGSGIGVVSCNDIKILNNTLCNSGRDGFKSSGQSKKILVDGNSSYNNTRDGFDFYDGFIQSILVNNIAYDNTNNGFDIKGKIKNDKYNISNSLFANNTAINNGKHGFYITKIFSCSFYNNYSQQNLFGYTINDVRACILNGCSAYLNKKNGFHTIANNRLLEIVNCFALNNGTAINDDDDIDKSGLYIEKGYIVVRGGVYGNWDVDGRTQTYGIYCKDKAVLVTEAHFFNNIIGTTGGFGTMNKVNNIEENTLIP